MTALLSSPEWQSLELHMANLPNGKSSRFLPTVTPADFKFVVSNGNMTGPAAAVVLADAKSPGTGRPYAGRDANRESPPASPQRRVPRVAGTAGGGNTSNATASYKGS